MRGRCVRSSSKVRRSVGLRVLRPKRSYAYTQSCKQIRMLSLDHPRTLLDVRGLLQSGASAPTADGCCDWGLLGWRVSVIILYGSDTSLALASAFVERVGRSGAQ